VYWDLLEGIVTRITLQLKIAWKFWTLGFHYNGS